LREGGQNEQINVHGADGHGRLFYIYNDNFFDSGLSAKQGEYRKSYTCLWLAIERLHVGSVFLLSRPILISSVGGGFMPSFIGDPRCKYNALSPEIRCAINPDGPCDGCTDFSKASTFDRIRRNLTLWQSKSFASDWAGD
jgi:Family of unknown function (DUF6464)